MNLSFFSVLGLLERYAFPWFHVLLQLTGSGKYVFCFLLKPLPITSKGIEPCANTWNLDLQPSQHLVCGEINTYYMYIMLQNSMDMKHHGSIVKHKLILHESYWVTGYETSGYGSKPFTIATWSAWFWPMVPQWLERYLSNPRFLLVKSIFLFMKSPF